MIVVVANVHYRMILMAGNARSHCCSCCCCCSCRLVVARRAFLVMVVVFVVVVVVVVLVVVVSRTRFESFSSRSFVRSIVRSLVASAIARPNHGVVVGVLDEPRRLIARPYSIL